MNQESRLSNYYSWMNSILRDFSEPYDTLMDILSNNPNLLDRVDFLKYLHSEYELGVIHMLMKQIHSEDSIYENSYFTSEELRDYTPLDRSYLLQYKVSSTIESLFTETIPLLLKKCIQTANELKSSDNSKAATLSCFDENEEYLTTQEAAKFLGYEVSNIYHLVHVKKLTPISAGGKVNKFKKSDLIKLYKFKSFRNEELETELEKEYQRNKKVRP
jgi:excisionase family DNA binding protein